MLHRIASHIWLLGVALLFMMACTQELTNPPNFPQLRQGDTEILDRDSLAVGELVSENGCLRIRDIDGRPNRLLIWPSTAKMTADGQGVLVRDNLGASLSFSVGNKMKMGGGETPFYHVQEIVKQTIPDDCPGPYWLVGAISASSE